MGLTFRKIEVKDLRDIEGLITENLVSIEPGLRIVDTSVLLGHARIDLVGLDSSDALVLIALGFTANDEMLLRALDGYSWCLEYPDTLRRLYPKARTKVGRHDRPPRMMFIAESTPDSFLRKLKHFIFPEVDCLRFLHLDVNGTPAVFFDTVERLRRPVAGGALAEETADLPQSIEQHPFIEGTPPIGPTPRTNGNGAGSAGSKATVQPSGAESTPVEADARPDAALDVDQYRGEWQDFLKQLGAEASTADAGAAPSDDIPVRPEVIDRISTLDTTLLRNPTGGLGAPEPRQAPRVGAGDNAGSPDHPENGSLTREWREFLNQLKGAQ